MTEMTNTIHTRVIVMEISLDGEFTVLGIIADSVHEVVELEADSIDHPPKVASRWNTEYILGIGKSNDNFIIILDIERIFSSSETTLMEATGFANK